MMTKKKKKLIEVQQKQAQLPELLAKVFYKDGKYLKLVEEVDKDVILSLTKYNSIRSSTNAILNTLKKVLKVLSCSLNQYGYDKLINDTMIVQLIDKGIFSINLDKMQKDINDARVGYVNVWDQLFYEADKVTKAIQKYIAKEKEIAQEFSEI